MRGRFSACSSYDGLDRYSGGFLYMPVRFLPYSLETPVRPSSLHSTRYNRFRTGSQAFGRHFPPSIPTRLHLSDNNQPDTRTERAQYPLPGGHHTNAASRFHPGNTSPLPASFALSSTRFGSGFLETGRPTMDTGPYPPSCQQRPPA